MLKISPLEVGNEDLENQTLPYVQSIDEFCAA